MRAKISASIPFLGLHLFLAPLMYASSFVATLHAITVVAIGMFWAIEGRERRVMYIGAYIVGSEVLWRMTDAEVFWEYGKYALIAVFLTALLRTKRARVPHLLTVYLLLLLPSIALIGGGESLNQARQQVSFNLSGPLTLFMAGWFFRNQYLTSSDARVILISLLGPMLGIAAITFVHAASVESIHFGTNSNFATSGGFGPNQVSAALGLGALAALLYLFYTTGGQAVRALVFIIMLLLIYQSALTFSRTGIALVLVSAAASIPFLLRTARTRMSVLLVCALLFGYVQFVMIPTMQDLTGGAFSERYRDVSTTGRTETAMIDLALWRQNPLFGVGPGESTMARRFMGRGEAAHTEFTRLLAEHGLLGLAALLALLVACLRNLLRAPDRYNRAFLVAMMAWAFGFMLVSGFRLAAPAFAVGITFAFPWFHGYRRVIASVERDRTLNDVTYA